MSNTKRSSNKPQVFISYCHENADFDTINFFESELKRHGKDRLDIYRDKNRLKVGDSLSKFEQIIFSVNSVILLLTPEYKNRVSRRKGGVYREYTSILARYKSSSETLRADASGDNLNLIPIIFSGNPSDSLPDELVV